MAIRRERHPTDVRSLRLKAGALLVVVSGALGLAAPALANQRDGRGAYQQWERMPQQQRERILQEQERFKRLPPSEQERLRREYEQRRN